jgi:hypothetical protein
MLAFFQLEASQLGVHLSTDIGGILTLMASVVGVLTRLF